MGIERLIYAGQSWHEAMDKLSKRVSKLEKMLLKDGDNTAKEDNPEPIQTASLPLEEACNTDVSSGLSKCPNCLGGLRIVEGSFKCERCGLWWYGSGKPPRSQCTGTAADVLTATESAKCHSWEDVYNRVGVVECSRCGTERKPGNKYEKCPAQVEASPQEPIASGENLQTDKDAGSSPLEWESEITEQFSGSIPIVYLKGCPTRMLGKRVKITILADSKEGKE